MHKPFAYHAGARRSFPGGDNATPQTAKQIANNRFADCDLDHSHVLSNGFVHPSFQESCQSSVETDNTFFLIRCVFIGKKKLVS